MADRWAVASGNWSSTATWNGGTLPTAADDVFADGFTVTIDQNVTVLSIRTTQRSGGTAGGGFVINASGITITCDVRPGTTTCLTVNATGATTLVGTPFMSSTAGAIYAVNNASSGTFSFQVDLQNTTLGNGNNNAIIANSSTGTINSVGSLLRSTQSQNNLSYIRNLSAGTVNHTGIVWGSGNSGGSNASAIRNDSSGSVNIVGNLFAETCASGDAVALRNTGSGTCQITGNVFGATVAAAGSTNNTIRNSGSGTVRITGNVEPSTVGTPVAINNSSNGIIEVSGSITAGTGVGVSSSSTGLLFVSGNLVDSSTGISAVASSRTAVSPSAIQSNTYRTYSGGVVGGPRTYYTGGQNLGQPTVSNVRQGTTFGVSNEFTGTLVVPSSQYVAFGVPVDSGVGSLQYLSLSDLQSALAPNAQTIAERSDDDTKALTFSWPVSGVTITGQKSVDNGAYTNVVGAINFLRTESNRHYYTLAYNAADRASSESTIRYKMTDGTFTKYFNVRIMPSTNSEVVAIKAKTDNLPVDPASSTQITSLLNNAPTEAF